MINELKIARAKRFNNKILNNKIVFANLVDGTRHRIAQINKHGATTTTGLVLPLMDIENFD